MEINLMHLKILLPYKVFADIKGVRKIGIETAAGSYGFLPHRLDCTAALVPGILSYETESEGERYMAIDEGILIKAGRQVSVSVRNAMGNAPLGELRHVVEQEMMQLDDLEINARSVMAKLETGFIRNFQQLRK